MTSHARQPTETCRAPQLTRLLTVTVLADGGYSKGPLVRASLLNVPGVQSVLADPVSQHIWVFADARLDSARMAAALARWSFRLNVVADHTVASA